MTEHKTILFIVGNAEPGKSGVGDYARRISEEISNTYSLSSDILSINDPFIETEIQEEHHAENNTRILRVPHTFSREAVAQYLDSLLRKTSYRWISLQYVGYAYHSLGIANSLLKLLQPLKETCQLHIMFHELWEGFGVNDSLKVRVRGLIQKNSIKRLVSTLTPSVTHTQNGFYLEQLQKLGIKARYLPLFGNIPIASREPQRALQLISDRSALRIDESNRDEFLIFVFFGSIYPSWSEKIFMEGLNEVSDKLARKVLFLSIGKLGTQRQKWDAMRSQYADRFEFVELGFLDSAEISILLQEANFGIATTPYEALGKSGSFVTMQEHGIPVFASENMLRQTQDSQSFEAEANAYPIDAGMIEHILHPPDKTPQQSRLQQTINSFVKDLNLL